MPESPEVLDKMVDIVEAEAAALAAAAALSFFRFSSAALAAAAAEFWLEYSDMVETIITCKWLSLEV